MNPSILVYRKVQPRFHQPDPPSFHPCVGGAAACSASCSSGTPRPAPGFKPRGSTRTSAGALSRTSVPVRVTSARLRAPRRGKPQAASAPYCTHKHASALGQDAAAQKPTHGSTKQGSAPACRWVVAVFVGAVAGTAQLPQQCACVGVGAVPVGRSCRPPARSCRPAGRTPPARTPLCSTTQTTTGRTAVHDGRARRWAVGSAAGVGCGRWARPVVDQPWQSALRNARERGAPPRERTDRRPCDIPAGLEPGRWPCTRGGEAEPRQSGGGAGYGGRAHHGESETQGLQVRSLRVLLRQMLTDKQLQHR